MKPSFHVHVVGFSILEEIEGAWTADSFKAMLEVMDYGDTTEMTDSELREMSLLSLQDRKPEEAAELLLRQQLSDQLTAGQMRNLSIEMMDEKMWESYADMSLHERMFHVASLLHAVFPRAFPEPDAVRVSAHVVAQNDAAKEILADSLNESFFVRLLADGMDGNSAIRRLFEKQLVGKSFPEADTIVWIVNSEAKENDAITIDVISSGYWLDALRDTESYDSSAYPDPAKVSRE